jgi:uncharacterized membrane protein
LALLCSPTFAHPKLDFSASNAGGGLIGILIGLLNTTLTTLTPLVQALLGSVFAILDPVVDALFQTLGLQIGTVDVVVHGVSCGRPALVG